MRKNTQQTKEFTMFTNVKEFCIKTGFPERTLKRYIKESKLPYHKAGRVYILDYEKTLSRLAQIAEETPQKRKSKRHKTTYNASHNKTFAEDIAYLKSIPQ